MATYIGTKFGNNAAQEWTCGTQTVLPEPTYSTFVLARHAERVKATMDRLNLKLISLRDKTVDIVAKIAADPGNHSLKKELQEVDDDIAKIEIEFKDEFEMKLIDDEKTAHSNAYIKS